MKTLKCAIAILALTAVASGCGLKQNPLTGGEERLGDGRATPEKPTPATPVRSDAVVLTAPDFQLFQEEKAEEFQLVGRVLEEGYTAKVTILNLNEFPGAVYDANTGRFRWAPAKGFVMNLGSGVAVNLVLKVRVDAVKPDAAVLTTGDREIRLRVQRDFSEPTIKRVVAYRSALREGESTRVAVTVHDKDADANDRNTWPRVRPESIVGYRSLGAQMWLESTRPLGTGTGEFEVTFNVDLSDVEVTDAVEDFRTSFSAASAFGKVGQPAVLTLTVFTSFSDLKTTWTQTLRLTAGQPTTYTFLVMDPKQELNPTLNSKTAPVNSTLTCVSSGRGVLVCTFTWTPTTSDVGFANAYVYIQSNNMDARDTSRPIKTFYLPYAVTAPPVVPPKGP